MVDDTQLLAEIMRSGRDDGLSRHQLGFSASQARMLAESLGLLVEKGLYNASDPQPLCRCCSNRERCWAGMPEDRIPGAGEPWWHGVVSLPWVGRRYRPGGVLVLGINHNEASGLHQEISLAISEAEAFRAGHKQVHRSATYRGSDFAYRTYVSATSVIDHLDGRTPEVANEPRQIAATIDRIARLQTIKCAPYGNRSMPTSAMWRNCSPLLLGDQLDILRPGHIVAFGTRVFAALTGLAGFHQAKNLKYLRRGRLEIAGTRAHLWGLYHPVARGGLWFRSQESLVNELKRLE